MARAVAGADAERPVAGAEAPVVIGIDPHKERHTAAALDERQRVLGQVRVAATRGGYRHLLKWAAGWPRRRWAVENAAGLGRSLAQRLLADGEAVVDVPPKLSARVRLLSTGHGRKTDTADAVSTAVAARGAAELQAAAVEGHATTLGLLSDRRDDWWRAAPRRSTACTSCSPSWRPAGYPRA